MPESGRVEGVPWCRHFDRAIDYRLVKEDRPPCIEEHNGCGNCPERTYLVSGVPEPARPSPVMWSRVDRELYPEIEKAIGEVFPGESDRVRLAAVAVWNVVMNRVPDR